ncbi:MAG: hypothetical protein WC833_13530 [Bacteroidales bacterium]|jgi:Tol biopolymer transport system component
MKKFVFSLAIIFSLFLCNLNLNAQDANANFAGVWTINAAQSTQGNGNFRGAKQLTVTQEGINLSVTRLRTGNDRTDNTSISKFTLDGKESVNTTERGSSKSVATWSADGKTLTILTSRSMNFNGSVTEMKSSEVWSMIGATLTITSVSQSPNGERKVTLVYDKK